MSSIGKAINKKIADRITGKSEEREARIEFMRNELKRDNAETGTFVMGELGKAKAKYEEVVKKDDTAEFKAAAAACYKYFIPKN